MDRRNGSHSHPDVIVIGGGIIGLASAWKLGSRGLQVVVLEQDGPISSASSASLGVLSAPSPLGQTPFNMLHRRSLRMFPEFADALREASGIDINYRRPGSLEIIPSEAQHDQASREIEFLESGEFPDPNTPSISLLSRTEAMALEPHAQILEYGALHCPSAAHISVEKTLEALTKACLLCGVDIVHHCRASDLSIVDNKVQGVYVDQTLRECSRVLVAAGAWTSQLGSELDEFAHMDPVRGQALLVRTDAQAASSIIKWKQRYIVPRGDGTYALGSTTEKKSGFDVNTTVEGVRDILSLTSEAVPALAAARIERMWAGLRPVGRDSKPHVGAVAEIEGLYVAAGHYKIGFGYLPLTAQGIAELIAEGESGIDFSELAPRRAEPARKRKRNANGPRLRA